MMQKNEMILGIQKENIKLGHSRISGCGSHSGIFNALRYENRKFYLVNDSRVEDPGQKPSGMTLCDGFTLIELLVVVLIIGILAAVAIPQYQKAVFKARATQTLTIFDTLIKAANLYYLANGTMPSSMDDMDIELPAINGYYYCAGDGTNSLFECVVLDYKLDLFMIYYPQQTYQPICHKICNARPNSPNATNFCASVGTLYEEGKDDGIQGYWNRYCMQQ